MMFTQHQMSTPESASPRFQFIDSMLKRRVPANITRWTAAELAAAMAAAPGQETHIFEVLQGGYTKPYIDSDGYYTNRVLVRAGVSLLQGCPGQS